MQYRDVEETSGKSVGSEDYVKSAVASTLTRVQNALSRNTPTFVNFILIKSTTETSHKSKSGAKKLASKNLETPCTMKKYFLHTITNDDIDHQLDNENLISNLSLYRKLDNGTYICELCSAKNSETISHSKVLITRHLLRAHTACQAYECSYCLESFSSEVKLRAHTEALHCDHHGSPDGILFQCFKCNHTSVNELLINQHVLRKHAAIYKYVCKCCSVCFKNWMVKHEHEKNMERGRKKSQLDQRYDYNTYDKCNAIPRNKQERASHLERNHSKDYYQNRECKFCSKLFSSLKSLQNHSPCKGVEGEAEAQAAKKVVAGFKCPDCNKMISSKDHLKKHARVHSGERPYACPECGQAFALRTTMRIHALSHRGIKPYTCSLCNLDYSQRSALMIHWKNKHKNLPAPPPIEIHQYFDENGNVLLPY